MFEIKCPECEANTKGLLRDYLQWRSDRRKCLHCGVQLEISNAIFCLPAVLSGQAGFGLCGLIFGVLVGSSHYWGFGNEWLRLVIAVLICWMVLPTIVQAGGQKSTIGIRNWSQVVPTGPVKLAGIGVSETVNRVVRRQTRSCSSPLECLLFGTRRRAYYKCQFPVNSFVLVKNQRGSNGGCEQN
jgi:phage shock protein PspC (stress-responsive transcriptional regulator)